MSKLVYRTVAGPPNSLYLDGKFVPIGIHAVIISDEGNILKISKYAVGPRCNGKGLQEFYLECKKYAEAMEHPPLNDTDYGTWYYMNIFADGDFYATDEQVAELIKEANEQEQ